MKVALCVFFVALLMLATKQSFCTNYYVDPSSAGSNQGTLTDPWKSIADIPWSINYFQPGDTLFFKRDQQYTGTLSINSSGSNGSPIVLMGYGAGKAPVFQYDVAHPTDAQIYDRTTIRLNQANYIVIDGFELTDVSIPETDHNVTANCGYGIYIYGTNGNGSHNLVKNVTVSRLGCGVAIDGGTDNTVTECTITNLRMILNTPDIAWDDFGAMGIMVGSSNNTITHNIIQDCWSNSYDYQIDGGAIEMYGAVSNNKIMYNKASENLGFMEFGSAANDQAYNNLIGYNLLINNGTVFWINTNNGYGVDVRNLQFFNNNVIETHAPRLPDVYNLIGIGATPSGSNVLTMKNNIFWINNSMNVTDPTAQPFNGPQLIHQSNLFHLSGGGMGYIMDATEKSLTAADQVFMDNTSTTDPSAWNYKLKQFCSAIDIGQNTGINKDYFDDAVPFGGAPDAGIAENLTVTVLPLQFISLNGYSVTGGNELDWETTNNGADHFEIEKSNEGVNFQSIATVAYNGNTSSKSTKYQFIDKNVSGDVQYYRVRVVESGNADVYSQIVTIKNNVLVKNGSSTTTKSSSSGKISVYPNPARNYVYVRIPGADLQNKEMVLANMSGVTLQQTMVNQTSNPYRLDVSKLPAGSYVIEVIDSKSGKNQSAMFTK
jgi:hypothetical protein